MSFITQQDLLLTVKQHILIQITSPDLATRQDLIAAACGEAQAVLHRSLFQRYDTAQIFSQQGALRNADLVAHARNIALYVLYQRVDDENIPERITANYENTMQLMLRVADGDAALDLPRIQTGNPSAPYTKFRGGGERPRKLL